MNRSDHLAAPTPGTAPAPASSVAGASGAPASATRRGDFDALPPERQEAIMRASLEGFGRHDYKGARTADIARRAGMSKGLLFFYFRDKRSLYLRTLDYLTDRIIELVVDEDFYAIDDFFDLMLYAGEQKVASLSRWPWALEFAVRAFYADHRDIRQAAAQWTNHQVDVMFDRFFKNVDFSRFRDDVDPREVLDMLIMLGDGYLHQRLSSREPIDLDALMDAYRRWCEILRGWAYR